MISGSLSLNKIVEAQNQYTWGLPHWYIFTPWGFAGFVLYAIATTAETTARPSICRKANRSWWPATLPSTRLQVCALFSGRVSGHVFHLGAGNDPVSGGWSAPFSFLGGSSWIWFFGKLLVSMCVFIWIRGTLPRLRQESADELCLEVCAAPYMLNLFDAACGISWAMDGALGGLFGDPGGGVCGMAWVGMRTKHFGARSYRYAE